MSITILHISDLHFVTEADKDKTRYEESFVAKFIENVRSTKIDYLIVSGDVADKSKKLEYDKASCFLNKLVSKLNVPKKNVLICMGNHDISWRELEEIADVKGCANLNQYEEKYHYFKEFYNEFYREGDNEVRQFTTDSVFAEIIDETHEIMLLGINTCCKESNQKEDHYGFIDKECYESYINNINPKYQNYLKCLVMHHNPKDLGKEKHNFSNWREIDQTRLGYPFVVFCGHIHGADAESEVKCDDGDAVHYISVGSLLKTESNAKYNLYTIADGNSELNIRYFNWMDDTEPSKQYWEEQVNSKAIKQIKLKQKVSGSNTLNDILSDDYEKTVQEYENLQRNIQNELNNYSDSPNSILDEIKKYQLYYSGHFHWNTDGNGENSKFRSHGYIDINYLVSHDETLEKITLLYKTIIEEIKSSTTRGKTLLVSIGLECNVIGARLSVLFPDFDFSYIPRRREAKDHNDLENKIGFPDHNTVILIRDITFDADESIEIIEERFKNKNIHLISLFYCGKRDKKNEIFRDVENAHFYSLIDDIEIPRCDLDESKCPVIKNNLQTIFRC